MLPNYIIQLSIGTNILIGLDMNIFKYWLTGSVLFFLHLGSVYVYYLMPVKYYFIIYIIHVQLTLELLTEYVFTTVLCLCGEKFFLVTSNNYLQFGQLSQVLGSTEDHLGSLLLETQKINYTKLG